MTHPLTGKPLAHDGYCRNKNEHGDPDILWISREALALTLGDCKQGEGVEYVRRDLVERVYQHRDELQENNSDLVLKNRALKFELETATTKKLFSRRKMEAENRELKEKNDLNKSELETLQEQITTSRRHLAEVGISVSYFCDAVSIACDELKRYLNDNPVNVKQTDDHIADVGKMVEHDPALKALYELDCVCQLHDAYEGNLDELIKTIRTQLTAQPVSCAGIETIDWDDAKKYCALFGPRCRDCADECGVCPMNGIGCGNRNEAVIFILDALRYGIEKNYIKQTPPRSEGVVISKMETVTLSKEDFERVMDALRPFAIIAENIRHQVNNDRWLEKPLLYAGDNNDPQKWTITGKGFDKASQALSILEKQGAR